MKALLLTAFLSASTTMGSWAGDPLGVRIRKELEQQNLALVDWNRGSDHKGDFYVELTTSTKKDFSEAIPWNGSKELQAPIEVLVRRAREDASKLHKKFSFEGLMINPCRDDPSKRFITVWFQDTNSPSYDDIMIHLLLNGAKTNTKRRSVTSEEYKELSDHGIPNSGEQAADGKTPEAPQPPD